MPLSLFIAVDAPRDPVPEAILSKISACIAATPGLERAEVFTPATAHDPYLDDGAPPPLAIQIDFRSLLDLEAACSVGGHLQGLVSAGLPDTNTNGGTRVMQQAMVTRRWPGPDPVFRNPPGTPHCTYLVDYPGPADDLVAWLSHYVGSHQPVMMRFPGIREIDICTRCDWVSALPFARADSMLKNKVVFDSPEALTAALRSPVREAMRADFRDFPPFQGGNTHYPMFTRTIWPIRPH